MLNHEFKFQCNALKLLVVKYTGGRTNLFLTALICCLSQ
jgi:hypothetical protein